MEMEDQIPLPCNSGTGAVNFAGPIGSSNGLGGITINSSDGAVIFSGTLDDANDRGTQVNLDAGSGNVDFIGAVGGTNAIDTFTVSDAADVTIQNVGGGSAGVDNALSITNSGTTIFNGTTYNANSQNYSTTYFTAGSTTISSSSDQIQFQNGAITLGSGSTFY